MSEARGHGWAVAPVSGYRIGTAERDRVRDLLERHTAEGRLSLDEFGERIDEVLRARTAVELDHALRELPPVAADRGMRPHGLPRPQAAWVLAPPLRPLALTMALGVVVTVLSVIGSLWPLWILLLVTRFGLLGSRRRGRGWAGPPWAGPHAVPRHARRWHADDPSWSSQTRWV